MAHHRNTNQLASKSSQKTTDSQNELVIPLLIAAVASYVIVMIAVLTYKSKNKPDKLEEKSQNETNLGLFFVG